jgi:hypothetical protein
LKEEQYFKVSLAMRDKVPIPVPSMLKRTNSNSGMATAERTTRQKIPVAKDESEENNADKKTGLLRRQVSFFLNIVLSNLEKKYPKFKKSKFKNFQANKITDVRSKLALSSKKPIENLNLLKFEEIVAEG